jgi:hypothetical protein
MKQYFAVIFMNAGSSYLGSDFLPAFFAYSAISSGVSSSPAQPHLLQAGLVGLFHVPHLRHFIGLVAPAGLKHIYFNSF